eukprot:Hpha_TRINITY_DN15664_c3_g6::TRINITY_DN15664_c3_g6_i1::g.101932::m.101932
MGSLFKSPVFGAAAVVVGASLYVASKLRNFDCCQGRRRTVTRNVEHGPSGPGRFEDETSNPVPASTASSMLTRMPETQREKLQFLFARYDKDRDGKWNSSEVAAFHREIVGEELDRAGLTLFFVQCKCSSDGVTIETLMNRYMDDKGARRLELEYGMAMGLAACIA